MKIFLLLFSFYFSLLSAIPCGDSADCNENRHQTEQTTHDHDKKNEVCSPLCFCACCGLQVYVFNSEPSPTPFVSIIKEKISFYKPSFIEAFVADIWQPPK